MVESGTTAPPPASLPASPTQRRTALRWYVLVAMLLFLTGALAGSWAIDQLRGWRSTPVSAPALVERNASDAPLLDVPTAAVVGPARPAPPPTDLATRVRLLEARLAELSVATGGTAGNAARAEGLLIAFAARRALDRGLALGTLESQLRLRFGDAQPNAVRTVIEVARTPVTLDWLQTEFGKLVPALSGGAPDEGLFSGFRREIGGLFTLRDADAPSTRPEQRAARAQRLLDAGLVDAAIREVETLPGARLADAWVVEARRYHEARRALDLIETAAILTPQERALTPAPARR